jgi:prolyl-tRNA synthetase
VWPVPVAPFEVVISVLNPNEVEPQEAGERLYDALRQQGIDVLLDLRDERPGVKFKDADLVGIPHRLVVGPRGLAEKKVEWKAPAATGSSRKCRSTALPRPSRRRSWRSGG